MDKFKRLLSNVLTVELKEKHYDNIWDMIREDWSIFYTLVDVATEDDLIAFLSYLEYCDSQAVDIDVADKIETICYALSTRSYKEGWYNLCAHIYTIGYDFRMNPLWGNLDPLLFAAREHNPAFAEAFIKKLRQFEYFPFDGERMDDDGVYRTLMEELVLTGDEEIIAICLKYGADPNAFTFRGDRLLDIAQEPIASLLRAHGGKNATEEERILVRTVYELRTDRLRQETVNALL